MQFGMKTIITSDSPGYIPSGMETIKCNTYFIIIQEIKQKYNYYLYNE
ncbi:Uncharacterised protein [Citrobacter werkmanii]|uniref:Uncharacterized protein n=1 Tax=Citrobacter werkmanii TaxID=67827 RepID=A0A9N8CQV4_9ENTR|nr:Uncharacterised protein [Citrobacter werkmanii]CAB5546256.1 Uncharacterised protein [Citrobacter werkmanii]CAB5566771.1 Uncharacterised protein [Citrobacter werkmanii]CAB5575861.1 Uncharacterised protein [Citrobacter werkmanii]CAB5596776.1 Uncharacterised protein [Citrobacter werkmanii]